MLIELTSRIVDCCLVLFFPLEIANCSVTTQCKTMSKHNCSKTENIWITELFAGTGLYRVEIYFKPLSPFQVIFVLLEVFDNR